MRFGLNSFLVSSAFSDDDRRHLGVFKEWGADFVELAVLAPEKLDVPALRRALADEGLARNPVCGMFPPEFDLRGDETRQRAGVEYLRRLIGLAAELGSPLVAGPFYSCVGRCHLHPPAERASQSALVASHLRSLCAEAQQAGIILAMEPLNRFETDFINTLGQARQMIEAVGSPVLKIHADTFHMHIEEDDSAAAVRAAGPLLGHLHASASHRGIPGRDQVDWTGIFTALKETGYQGDMAVESFPADNTTIARAASIWMPRYDSPAQLSREGLQFLRQTWNSANPR
ncbi:MAG: sugar phosphate isomerase/epimerase family protein [Chthoniobacterales bacterium]